MKPPRGGPITGPTSAGTVTHDPHDRNIRLAPSFPLLAEVETAMAGVATCVALAAAEKLSARHTAAASTPEGN